MLTGAQSAQKPESIMEDRVFKVLVVMIGGLVLVMLACAALLL
jgi:hypothetical protein